MQTQGISKHVHADTHTPSCPPTLTCMFVCFFSDCIVLTFPKRDGSSERTRKWKEITGNKRGEGGRKWRHSLHLCATHSMLIWWDQIRFFPPLCCQRTQSEKKKKPREKTTKRSERERNQQPSITAEVKVSSAAIRKHKSLFVFVSVSSRVCAKDSEN